MRATDDPVDRRVEELYDIVPTAPRRAYDMRKVVTAIVDDGDVLWMKPEWAKNLVTGLARVGGQPVGIVANQPMVLGGALDVNAADKAARFVWLCDAFNIPLVFLHDVPGFIVGSAVEKQGIIRHGAKMLFAVSRGDGAEDQRDPAQELRRGLLRDERPRVRSRLHRRVADRRDRGDGPRRRGEHHPPQARSKRSTTRTERTAKRLELAEEIRANIDPYIAAGHAQLDDVIDPADTRAAIARGLRHQRRQARRPPGPQARRAARSWSRQRSAHVASAPMAEIRAEIAANVWQVVVEEGQMVAEGDEICILESMKMEIPVVTEIPGVVRELHVEPEQTVQEGDLIAIIDES